MVPPPNTHTNPGRGIDPRRIRIENHRGRVRFVCQRFRYLFHSHAPLPQCNGIFLIVLLLPRKSEPNVYRERSGISGAEESGTRPSN